MRILLMGAFTVFTLLLVACANPEPTQTPYIGPTDAAPTRSCDPAYPAVCIPSPPPDLDCGQISHRRFHVLPPDPHGFDRDRDGIGCEWN